MEDSDMDPEEAYEPSEMFENEEAKSGASTQEDEEDPDMKVDEEPYEIQHQEVDEEEEEEEEEEEGSEKILPQRVINLNRDLTTLVTNIQTAADAKESLRQAELEEARRLRLERLEKDLKSSQEIFEEITRGWSLSTQRAIPQELHEALNNQQQLCDAIIEDKKKLINDLQQELKVGDDRFVKDLRKQTEELDLMMERMEDQIKTLIKAYREELTQIERVYTQESEILLTKDKFEWDQHMKGLWEEELKRLTERTVKVEEYENIIHNMMIDTWRKHNIIQTKQHARFQVLERESKQLRIAKFTKTHTRHEIAESKFSLTNIKTRLSGMKKLMANLSDKYKSQRDEFTKKSRYLSEDYERKIKQYECIQKQLKHFAVADGRKFEEMWLMIDAEVKQLVERALDIDSQICKQHLGVAWERPVMGFMELCGPIQPQRVPQLLHTGQDSQDSQRMMDPSVRKEIEAEGSAVQSESGAEEEEEKLPMETLKRVMELLCDKASFLMEDTLLKLLIPLGKEGQTVVKLGSLLSCLGIEEKDIPKLAAFLLKYRHQQREQTEVRRDRDEEFSGWMLLMRIVIRPFLYLLTILLCLQDVCDRSGESNNKAEEEETEPTTHLTSDLDPYDVVPALKSFLRQHMRSRESSARQHHSVYEAARDSSEDEAYWQSMGSVICEDQLRLWDTAEHKLRQYQAVLADISALVPETESLQQQNRELRMLLQQTLKVSTDLEM
ncbi:dynein regulatory complex protein 1 isoform X2 [Pseudochaenichthys georgianus]|uniref:dynein regulatory complex protein 1 isoform X2 n=1 Tax=Pseudochaenichthys georgianus TaxID=52239 RepID=UPI00146B4A1C|nr:dynein regulatory complex protein 1 isoform X2 [Pseudochaenichthys georgianus]